MSDLCETRLRRLAAEAEVAIDEATAALERESDFRRRAQMRVAIDEVQASLQVAYRVLRG